jgi:GNAT superfamily N-acetyltransferase
VKRLYVAEPARGMRIGTRLLEALHQAATRRGYRELRLDTHGDPAALALFAKAGYQPIPDYNGNELARFWFSRSLA